MDLRKHSHKLIWVGVFLLALFLRLYNISSIPPGFFCDELIVTYEAYSVCSTGYEAFPYGESGQMFPGKKYPLFPQGFGNGINPVYFWASFVMVWLFGLTDWVVRLPSVFFGIGTVVLVYFLGKTVFNKYIGLIAMFLLAVSPWHLHFSRIAFEVISLPFFFTLGLILLFKGLEKRRYLIMSAIPFSISFYCYATAKLFVPLFLIGFLILFYKRFIKKDIFYILAFIFLFWLFLYPVVNHTLYGEGQKRFDIVSVFNPYFYNQFKDKMEEKYTNNALVDWIFMSKQRGQIFFFLRNYLLHISPDYLFFTGDANPRHSVPNIGQLYLFSAFLLLISFSIMWKKAEAKYLVFLFWALLAPIPAAITAESIPHAIRSFEMLPSIQILCALGLYEILSKLNNYKGQNLKIKKLSLLLFSLFIVANISFYLYNYFVIYPVEQGFLWQFGMKEAVHYAESAKDQYNKVYISDILYGHIVFPMFYNRADPKIVQEKKYTYYSHCNMEHCIQPNSGNLYIMYPWEARYGTVVKKIQYPNGKDAIILVK